MSRPIRTLPNWTVISKVPSQEGNKFTGSRYEFFHSEVLAQRTYDAYKEVGLAVMKRSFHGRSDRYLVQGPIAEPALPEVGKQEPSVALKPPPRA